MDFLLSAGWKKSVKSDPFTWLAMNPVRHCALEQKQTTSAQIWLQDSNECVSLAKNATQGHNQIILMEPTVYNRTTGYPACTGTQSNHPNGAYSVLWDTQCAHLYPLGCSNTISRTSHQRIGHQRIGKDQSPKNWSPKNWSPKDW